MKAMRRFGLGLCFFVSLCLGSQAESQLLVDRVILALKTGQRPIENVVIRNSGDQTLFVSVTPDVMIHPGLPDERREETGDLIVSPKRFSLDPGGQRTVRVLLKKPLGGAEQVYRVKFVPEDRGFGKDVPAISSGKQTTLKVLTGIGILILVEPTEPSPKLKWKRDGDTLTFTNEGNVNIFLSEGRACRASGEDCSVLAVDRLYPGNTLKVKAPADTVVAYRQEIRGEFQELVIPPAP